jgi:hypothetical protein
VLSAEVMQAGGCDGVMYLKQEALKLGRSDKQARFEGEEVSMEDGIDREET